MTSSGTARGETILVVEDETDLQRLLEFFLKSVGYGVVVAQTGREALRKAGETRIALVLLDMMLPELDGVGVCQELRRRPETANVPVIMYSAMSQVADKIRALEAGADEYLTKPVDMKELAARVAALIQRTRRLQEAKPDKQGRVFGFLGAEGGVGTTTVVLNVGALLLQGAKRVVAIEMQPYLGTFALHLKGSPTGNLAHVLKLEAEKIDRRALSERLSKSASGLQVLFGPQKADEFGALDPGRAEAVVKQAALAADFTVIDLGSEPSGATQAVLKLCDVALLVTEPDPLAVGSACAKLRLLQGWGLGGGQVQAVVVSRSSLSSGLSLKDVRSQLGCEILGVMPSAGDACMAAIGQGSPLVLSKPESMAAATLREMAGRLSADVVVGIRL